MDNDFLGNRRAERHKQRIAHRVAAARLTQGDQGLFRLTVSDNGIGFEDKYAERIFGIFERLHGRDGREGTGVGLAIVRKIIERHGGAIRAQGTPGCGATFIVELPLPDLSPGAVAVRHCEASDV